MRCADFEKDAGRGARLPPGQERDLVRAAEAGDAEACRRLVDAFLPAIATIARRYAAAGVERGDLLQEGVVGLLRAVSRYEPRLDVPFWAYASWWVRLAMQEFVAEVTRPVVLSDRALRALALISAARQDHMRHHGREPSRAALAAATGFNAAQLDRLLAVELTPRALEEPVGSGDDPASTVGAMLSDPSAEQAYEGVLDRIEIQEVRRLAAGLERRERIVLAGHFGLGQPSQTLSELGGRLGLTAERVRQIEALALEKLRNGAAPRTCRRRRPPARRRSYVRG